MLSKFNTTHFLGCSDLELIRKFYTDILGLEFKGQDGNQSVVFSSKNAVIRISVVQNFTPQPFTVLGWNVVNIEETVIALRDKGVEFIVYDQFDQDDLGIWSMGNVRIAWFSDPSGNILSVTQSG